MLTLGVFFSQALVSLCILAVAPASPPAYGADVEGMGVGPGGYAAPRAAIRVAMARDEEAVGGGGRGEVGAAAGVWAVEGECGMFFSPADFCRFSPAVDGMANDIQRVDPNRIFWARNTAAPAPAPLTRSLSRQAAPRPPSYESDGGVGYVVEAAPRSIAPPEDVPLPIHPAERGRIQGGVGMWREGGRGGKEGGKGVILESLELGLDPVGGRM